MYLGNSKWQDLWPRHKFTNSASQLINKVISQRSLLIDCSLEAEWWAPKLVVNTSRTLTKAQSNIMTFPGYIPLPPLSRQHIATLLGTKNVNVNVNVNVIFLPTEYQGVQRTRSEMSVHSRIDMLRAFGHPVPTCFHMLPGGCKLS